MATSSAPPDRETVSVSVPVWIYRLLFAAAVALFWFPRLSRGFWVDEAASFWIVKDGFARISQNLQVLSEQSVLYSYLSSVFFVGGPHMELWLRIPSVIGVLLAAIILYKLTERIAGPGTGFLAVIPFCSAEAIVEIATNARPYAMGLPVILLSFWSLREWVQTGERKPLAIYCLCSPLIIHFHYLFGMVFVVQLVYLGAAWKMSRRFSLAAVAGAAALIALGALPLIRHILTLTTRSTAWKHAALPGLTTFFSFYPLNALLVAVLAIALFRFLYPKWFGPVKGLPFDDTVLLLSWLLLGPLVLFAGTHLTGIALFSTRYLIYALLPFFVILALMLRQIGNERARLAVVAGFVLNVAMYLPRIQLTEWRAPLAVAREMAGAEAPIIVRSGFTDSSLHDLSGEPKASSFLFAPLAAYPIPNPVIPAPYFMDPAAERLILSAIDRYEKSHRRFCLLANEDADIFDTLPALFSRRGYSSTIQEVKGFKVILFEKRT